MATSLLVAALALAASLDALAPVPAAMAAPASVAVEGWYQALEKNKEVVRETLHEAIHVMHKYVEEHPLSLGAGEGDQGGRGGTADAAIRSIITGGLTFSLAAVDITTQLTVTTRCDNRLVTGRPVACSSQACSTMARRQPPLCASFPSNPCAVLYQGYITLVPGSRSVQPYSPPASQFYACRLGQDTSSGMAAVLGLGWRGANSLGLQLQGFSYSVSSNREISVSVGVSGGAARGGNTVRLIDNPYYPDLYYVRVIGINVVGKYLRTGELDLRQDGSGGGVFLSTTMPLTLLNEDVYDSLIGTLREQLPSNTSSELNSRQLCYGSGTQTPAITLVLDGGAMKLPVENCWYKQASDDSVCLAILPSPWPTGESVLGTMMQSGWRMTYNLKARTLTFQSSSSSSTVLHNSSCVLWVPLLLLLSSFTTFL